MLGRAAIDGNQDFAVLIIDLDDFKLVNDTHGHQIGDKVLKAVVVRIKNRIREGDVVARIGGDEFAILLKPEIDSVLVDKIRIKLRKIALEPIVFGGVDHHFGMSIGYSKYCECEGNLSLLLNQADQSMYCDKSRKDARKSKANDCDQRSKIAEAVKRLA